MSRSRAWMRRRTTPPLCHTALTRRELLSLKPVLDREAERMETPAYVPDDPVQFMHGQPDVLDAEVAGFLAAMMAWGRRDIVIAKTRDLLRRIDGPVAAFAGNYSAIDSRRLEGFRHRTFDERDLDALFRGLRGMLLSYGSVQGFFATCHARTGADPSRLMGAFGDGFRTLVPDLPRRTLRHIPDPGSKGAAKRLWMYLRWCVRRDSPADLGIWDFLAPSELRIPLDVHVARQSRRLGLLTRATHDAVSVERLTSVLRMLDPDDPVRYDYALLGIGLAGGVEVDGEAVTEAGAEAEGA